MEKELVDIVTTAAEAGAPSATTTATLVSTVVAAIITIAFSLSRLLKEYKENRETDDHNVGIIKKLDDMYQAERQARLDAEARADALTKERDESMRGLLVEQKETAQLEGRMSELSKQLERLERELQECKDANKLSG